MPKHKKKRNTWKCIFFWLLGFNVLVLLCILALIFWPVSETETPTPSEDNTQRSSEFTVRTSKQNVNELVNAYIETLLDDSDHQYSISLDKDVELIGELPVFSSTVPVSVHLEPVVQDNGDVILKQESISIGKLALPNKKIMEYLKKYLPMPEWVTVDPKNEEIYVAVTDMEIRSNLNVSVESFDLESNNLAFNIEIPYETLGIEKRYY
ncbi:MAG TPA: YpmS family protein [Lentibacillus sp.]|uniref:YpmS family protein n=1 Tax=Lentibacillus sp. TaxID=1925746 RepID=UPI002B4AB9A3|nr:YpmS family protein [Lentibacillus sp.]HLR60811.1 YpmS family protein [Lentibacillus sp.]